MAENIASLDGTAGPPAGGDPSLGPNDLYLELELVVVSKESVPVQQEASLRLSNALTPAAQDAVVAAIQSSLELMRQSAITQLSEAILKRSPQPKQQLGRPPNPGFVPASPPPGDPRLGPNDAGLKTRLRLVGQKETLCDDHASARLPDALTLPARGAAAAAIDTSLEVLLKNALAQMTAAMEKRLPKSQRRQTALVRRSRPRHGRRRWTKTISRRFCLRARKRLSQRSRDLAFPG